MKYSVIAKRKNYLIVWKHWVFSVYNLGFIKLCSIVFCIHIFILFHEKNPAILELHLLEITQSFIAQKDN